MKLNPSSKQSSGYSSSGGIDRLSAILRLGELVAGSAFCLGVTIVVGYIAADRLRSFASETIPNPSLLVAIGAGLGGLFVLFSVVKARNAYVSLAQRALQDRSDLAVVVHNLETEERHLSQRNESLRHQLHERDTTISRLRSEITLYNEELKALQQEGKVAEASFKTYVSGRDFSILQRRLLDLPSKEVGPFYEKEDSSESEPTERA